MKIIQALLLAAILAVSGCGISKTKDPVTGEKQSVAIQSLVIAEQGAATCLVSASQMADSGNAYLANLLSNEKFSQTTGALLLQAHMFLNAEAVSRQVTACVSQVEYIAQAFNLTDRQRIASGERVVRAAIVGGVAIAMVGPIMGAFTAAAASKPIYNINGSGRQVNINDLPSNVNSGTTANVLSGDQTTTETPGQGGTPGTISNSGEQGQQVGVTNTVTIGGGRDGNVGSSMHIGTNSNDPISEQGMGVTGSGSFAPDSSSSSENFVEPSLAQ